MPGLLILDDWPSSSTTANICPAPGSSRLPGSWIVALQMAPAYDPGMVVSCGAQQGVGTAEQFGQTFPTDLGMSASTALWADQVVWSRYLTSSGWTAWYVNNYSVQYLYPSTPGDFLTIGTDSTATNVLHPVLSQSYNSTDVIHQVVPTWRFGSPALAETGSRRSGTCRTPTSSTTSTARARTPVTSARPGAPSSRAGEGARSGELAPRRSGKRPRIFHGSFGAYRRDGRRVADPRAAGTFNETRTVSAACIVPGIS